MQPFFQQPSLFYAPDRSHAQACIDTSKVLYDLGKSLAPPFLTVATSLPTLLTHAKAIDAKSKPVPFTSEQIYAQLSMHTNPLIKRMEQQIKVLQQHVAQAEAQQEQEEAQEDEENEEDDQDGEEDEEEDEQHAMDDDEDMEDMEDGEDDGEDDEDDEAGENEADNADDAGEYRGRGGVTEDAFFSLDDMEKFADMYEGSEDEGEIDPEDDENMDDDDEEKDEDGEDEEDDFDDDGDMMDLAALRAKAIRAKHEASLRPFDRRLGDEEIDLDEDVGEIDPDQPERYEDFFDPPPKELLKKRGKKGKAGKSMEDHYAEEDAQEYVDDDDMDEFGGAFKELSTSAREGTLGQARISGKKAEEEELQQQVESETVDPENESSYERSQRKLQEQISQIEKKLVQPREWAQLGEVTGKARPVDSLLDHHLEFDHAGKVAPVITQEYTEELEAMIRRRILKEDFNDVLRRFESDLPKRSRKPDGTELNEEKSSIGLAEVYEQEYVAEQRAAEGKPSLSEEKVSKEHEAIAGLVGALFHKLDALCNFHFTPKSIHAGDLEVQPKANVSSIQLEELLPTHMSSSTHVAPQEVYDVSEKAMVGSTELSSDEKKSRRRRMKAQRKKAFDAAQLKEKAKLKSMGKEATEGNAEQGILRKAISTKEMKAATTARNVIQAGGKSVVGPAKSSSNKKNIQIAHGQNTKFNNSSAFFSKMQSNVDGPSAKKQKTTR